MNSHSKLNISIPVPCHEVWNKMTANEKGAFCGKCCKTVIDFTNKTPEEISAILIVKSGKKVCGRFMSDQLTETALAEITLNVSPHLLYKPTTQIRSFALALFIVFGTGLFSCSTPQGDVVGKIAFDTAFVKTTVDSDTIEKASIDTSERIITGEIAPTSHCTPQNKNSERNEILKGDVMVLPDSVVKTSKSTPTKVVPEMGKVKVNK
jgi:hypothetical protein